MEPVNAPKLGKKGKVTATKYVNPPSQTLVAARNQLGHALFFLLVYRRARLSNTGMA